ncbi:MAG: hypothetical protein GX493_01980 [Firmicutes bacterium]|nr:hypothetical protein [Bacillota bacterium]
MPLSACRQTRRSWLLWATTTAYAITLLKHPPAEKPKRARRDRQQKYLYGCYLLVEYRKRLASSFLLPVPRSSSLLIDKRGHAHPLWISSARLIGPYSPESTDKYKYNMLSSLKQQTEEGNGAGM